MSDFTGHDGTVRTGNSSPLPRKWLPWLIVAALVVALVVVSGGKLIGGITSMVTGSKTVTPTADTKEKRDVETAVRIYMSSNMEWSVTDITFITPEIAFATNSPGGENVAQYLEKKGWKADYWVKLNLASDGVTTYRILGAAYKNGKWEINE